MKETTDFHKYSINNEQHRIYENALDLYAALNYAILIIEERINKHRKDLFTDSELSVIKKAITKCD